MKKIAEDNLLNELAVREHIGINTCLTPNLDCIRTTNTWYYVTEYCNGGSLADLIATFKGRLDTTNLKNIMRQLTQAQELLINKKLVHSDINPKNIMLHCKDPHLSENEPFLDRNIFYNFKLNLAQLKVIDFCHIE